MPDVLLTSRWPMQRLQLSCSNPKFVFNCRNHTQPFNELVYISAHVNRLHNELAVPSDASTMAGTFYNKSAITFYPNRLLIYRAAQTTASLL
jgi:hypothetical protein